MKIKWKCLFGSIGVVIIGVPLVLSAAGGLCYLVGWLVNNSGHVFTNIVFGLFIIAVLTVFIGLVAALYEECAKRYGDSG